MLTRHRREGKYLVRFNLLLNLGAYLIERQSHKVIVVYTDIKLFREKVLKASGVNPGVRWAGVHMTVDSIDYKKAMLMFSGQNNIAAFKRIFIDQFLFAVKTYF